MSYAVSNLQALMMRTLLIDSISLRLTGKRTDTGVDFFTLLSYFVQMNVNLAMSHYIQARNMHGTSQTLHLFYPSQSRSLRCTSQRD